MLDEDVQLALAGALRKRGYDVLHIQELERKSLSDREQLRYAAKEKRCFFTYNVKDFVLLHNEYLKNNEAHYGIWVSKQAPIGISLKKILGLLLIQSKEDNRNKLQFL